MARPRHIPFVRRLRRFLGAEEGAALVEFAIALPTMLLLFAVIIEGSRMMLSYQSAIAGVRDAVRYMSRVVPADICARGTSVAGYSTQLLSMVRDSRAGTSVFPDAVTVTAVTPSYACVSGSYRAGTVAVMSVTAELTMSFPFAGVFDLVGATRPDLTTTVTDRARVIGS